jgi:hypothetical protein
VQPVINLLRDHLLEADLILGDETVVQVLKESGRAAQTKSYLWAQMTGSGPQIRLFSYTPGRGGQHAQPLYDGIKPGVVLMSDGYEVYNTIATVRGAIHLGCWAHARRYFVEAEAAIPKAARGPESLATQFISAIGELYVIEAKTKDLSVEQRGQQRQQFSKPVTVTDNIIGVPFKRYGWITSLHPAIKSIMQVEISQQRTDHAPYTKENFYRSALHFAG